MHVSVSNQPNALEKEEGSRSASLRRKKDVLNNPVKLQPRKKGKTVSSAVVETVFGNLRNSTTNDAELRRKRDEDAQKCSRITKTIGSNRTKTPVYPEKVNETEDSELEQSTSCQPAINPTHSDENRKSHHPESGASLCIVYGR